MHLKIKANMSSKSAEARECLSSGGTYLCNPFDSSMVVPPALRRRPEPPFGVHRSQAGPPHSGILYAPLLLVGWLDEGRPTGK